MSAAPCFKCGQELKPGDYFGMFVGGQEGFSFAHTRCTDPNFDEEAHRKADALRKEADRIVAESFERRQRREG